MFLRRKKICSFSFSCTICDSLNAYALSFSVCVCVCVCVCVPSHARVLGECLTIHSLPVLFFFKVEISLHTLIPLFMPESVHSGSASLDDHGQMFPYKLCARSIPDRFPHYAWTAA